jgi:enoyl-CoA hydratase
MKYAPIHKHGNVLLKYTFLETGDIMTHPNGSTVLDNYQTYIVEIENHIAHVKFNRTDKANALNQIAWDEMESIFNTLDETLEARVIILSGEGKHFCAGIDLSMFQTLQQSEGDEGRKREQLRKNILKLQASVNAIENCSKPVLAATHGACVGGGIDIISACDMRYATDDAFFSIEEINLGMVADLGTMQRLPKLIGQGIVRELAYTGRRMYAKEAYERHFVNEIFADKETMYAEVESIAAMIATKSPLSVRGSKHILNHARDHSVADGLNYIATWNAAMFFSNDLQEAITAKMIKRDPHFED